MDRKGVYFQVPATRKMGGLTSPSPSPPLHGGRGLYKEAEGNRTERSSRGLKALYKPMSTVHSGKASDGPVCLILGSHHPCFMSPWIHGRRSPNLPEL